MLLLASQSTGLQIDSKDFIRKEFLTTDVEKTSERRVSTCLLKNIYNSLKSGAPNEEIVQNHLT